MENSVIINKAIEELQKKTFGTTEQLLSIHEVAHSDTKPEVLRVDRDRQDGVAIVYFRIKDEKFYLAIYLNTVPEVSVTSVGTESNSSVYFRATSGGLNNEQLKELTKLTITGGWNIGDRRKTWNSFHTSSTIFIEPNPEPDEFEDKIKKLLDFLELDKEGIAQLIDKADGYIQVASIFHKGNSMLGGHLLDRKIIKRLAALNLEVDFDLYAEGNPFTE